MAIRCSLGAEDDPRDTQKPRLRAASADISRIRRVKAVKITLQDGSTAETTFSLERDTAMLDELVGKRPDLRLVVIDPLSAYLGKIDSHKDAEVRSILAPLSEMAARRNIAIVGIVHMKKSEASALMRVGMSVAFVAAARSILGFAEDPDDPDRRVMVDVKRNLIGKAIGLGYRIEENDEKIARVVWQGQVDVDVNSVLGGAPRKRSEASALEEAVDYLREDVLADGPKPPEEIQRLAKRDGFTWATIRRAKKKLRIESKKNSLTGGWSWRLPEDAQDAHEDAQEREK